MSEITEIEGPSRFQTRKRLDKPVGLLSWHHTRPLRTLKDILSEQSRVYRAMINGVIPTSEGTRLVFVLKEIRCTREAIDAADAAAAEAAAATAAAQAKAEPTTLSFNVVTVPEGYSYQSDGSFQPLPPLRTEHTPMPEPEHERAPQLSSREVLEARLAALPDKMLYALAGIDDADAE